MPSLDSVFDPSSIDPAVNFDTPALRELISRDQWLVWKYVQEPGKIKPTKKPASPRTGFAANTLKDCGTYAEAIAKLARSRFDGIGYRLSPDDAISGGDLDGCRDAETGQLSTFAASVVALAETYIEVSPSGEGLRIFWRGKIPSAIVNHAAGVEAYGDGRYLTITGEHVPGTPNEIREAPRTLEILRSRVAEFKATPTPQLPAADLPKPAAATSLHPSSKPNEFFRRVNSEALLSLSSWVPTVFPGARFQPGTKAYRISSKDLGRDLEEDLSISPEGIVDFGIHDMGDARDGKRTPIDVVIDYGGAPDAKAAAFWLCERFGRAPKSLGWNEDDGLGAILADQLLASPSPTALAQHPLDALSLGRGLDWTYPDGLLGEITDWILASSRRPNRPFAVVSALATLSVVCGRHLYGPTGTALNLYIVCLASTGVGKGRPLGAVAELLRAAKLDNLHTSGKLFSVSAIETLIKDQPCCVATVDEIGANLLGRMSHAKASTHELALRGALLELWSREQGAPPFGTHGRGNERSTAVPSPSLSLFGVSTAEAFYSAVTSGSVKDGFLNRFLVTNAAPRSRANEVSEEARRVPARLSAGLLDIVPVMPGNIGHSLGVFSPAVEPDGTRLRWADPATKDTAAQFEEDILAIMDAHPDQAPLMGRIFEYAVRLASLHAVSRQGRGAAVTLSDLAWGAALVIQSAKAMIEGTSALMAANDYEAKFNLVRNTIQEAGKLTRSELLRKIRNINARERDDIIRHLKDGGWIVDSSKETKGRQAFGWRWVG